MAMLRAVLDGCSTTGRSMLPALGASLSPWSIFVQSRGAKSAGRTVEICLLQDVEGLGRDGEVVSVKPGRARNHLVPYKFAAYSSPERLAEAAKKRESWDVRETVDDAAGVDPAVKEAETCIKILTNSTLVVKRIVDKTTNQPRVPVTAELIVKEVLRQRKLEIDPRSVLLKAPIKTYGTHRVPLSFAPPHEDVKPLTLSVVKRFHKG
ncbi:uncharacterized protein MICPUCDRAFT_56936 [Micromonas pusilla CCMP1545]|uniref:Large ribosomal subunit protein bL9c n=1 Tax=Micromonas pusilla (strain CCMP1545) TaxID=564608 RepID=C1MPK3_MICPC|nr:uncharacterized protein MICPUCDRAFT_56936 [Micromonas pusilla CCMP1545]EEH57545.1 predicted protein [Micromonas pusilla CCMP1545]|eukprot:XP_003057594.1 predicted protein [Micromonas pusilla CCMP1545]